MTPEAVHHIEELTKRFRLALHRRAVEQGVEAGEAQVTNGVIEAAIPQAAEDILDPNNF